MAAQMQMQLSSSNNGQGSSENEGLKNSVLETKRLFFFFFFTWSSSYSLFAIWLGQEINLNGSATGIIFSVNAIFTLCMQPLYGFISDKLGLKKNILFMISLLLVFTVPLYFRLRTAFAIQRLSWAIVGGIYLGTAFLAGIGAIETFIEKVSRKYQFEYGRTRMWGSSVGLGDIFCRSAV